jgi:hypothetical protein
MAINCGRLIRKREEKVLPMIYTSRKPSRPRTSSEELNVLLPPLNNKISTNHHNVLDLFSCSPTFYTSAPTYQMIAYKDHDLKSYVNIDGSISFYEGSDE